VANKAIPNQDVVLRPMPWHLLRKTPRIKMLSGKKKNPKRLNLLASSKKEEISDEEDEQIFDKKAFMNSFIESWKTSQNNKKAKKSKRKRSDNDTSDSEGNYSQSFKLVASKPKRAKKGISTTKVIGETTVNGSKKPFRILIDTGSSTIKPIPGYPPHDALQELYLCSRGVSGDGLFLENRPNPVKAKIIF
jgi:hypothetical protein